MDGHSDQMQPSDVTVQLDAAASSQAAAEYRQVADEHVKTLKDFWKDFLVSGIFILAAIVIIFACLAWFAANNRVGATGSSISAQGATFTVTAEGEGETGAHVGYYEREERTDDEKREIDGLSTEHSMVVTLSSNLNNNDAGGIYPGARGVITFTVTPVSKSLPGVTIDISRILKTGTGDVTKDEASRLLQLMRGHLLFFRDMDSNGYYSKRIADSKIVLDKENFQAKNDKGESQGTTEPVTVHLYWVWPEYIQNFVLVKDANYYKNLFAAQNENDDYNALQAYVNGAGDSHENNHWNEFYATNAQGDVATNAPNLAADMSSADIAACASLYNNADEYLGTNVTYLQLELNAREGVQ